MGVRILPDRLDECAALYDSSTGTAFGPLFCSDKVGGASEAAERFLRWLRDNAPALGRGSLIDPGDARYYTVSELHELHLEWLSEQESEDETG